MPGEREQFERDYGKCTKCNTSRPRKEMAEIEGGKLGCSDTKWCDQTRLDAEEKKKGQVVAAK